jgi:hypothetical protein
MESESNGGTFTDLMNPRNPSVIIWLFSYCSTRLFCTSISARCSHDTNLSGFAYPTRHVLYRLLKSLYSSHIVFIFYGGVHSMRIVWFGLPPETTNVPDVDAPIVLPSTNDSRVPPPLHVHVMSKSYVSYGSIGNVSGRMPGESVPLAEYEVFCPVIVIAAVSFASGSNPNTSCPVDGKESVVKLALTTCGQGPVGIIA